MVYQFKGHDVTKVVDETKFLGRKTLSITNCPEVQLLKGGLESVQGLEEVNLADVRKIVLEVGAFSGKLLKRISGEVTVELLMARWLLMHTHVAIFATVSRTTIVTGMKRGTFNRLVLEKMHLDGNFFMGDIASKTFMDMQVTNLT